MAEQKQSGKTEIVGGHPMTPAEAQVNKQQVEEEQKNITDPPKDRNVPPGSSINQGGGPETIRAAEAVQKESGASKAKRVDTADVDPAGEKAPQGWNKAPNVYVMTNVDGEKMSITTKQWERYGQRLRAKGWTTPEFAEGSQGGNEEIPNNVVWGKDAPGDAPPPA